MYHLFLMGVIIMATFINYDIEENRDFNSQALQGLGHIENIKDWQEILTTYQKLKEQYAPRRIFLILEDEGQANYTSGHRSHYEPFDNEFGIELDYDSTEYQTACVPKIIQHYAKQLKNKEYHKTLEDCSAKMALIDEDDLKALLLCNQNSLPIMDKEMVVLAGEFESESLKLALLINGYFSADFDPFENLAIIEMMADYGYEFIGLGASILGFVKTDKFDEIKLSELIDKIGFVYHFDDEVKTQFKSLLLQNNYAILSYGESPSELLGCYDS
ncbi:hypothetical protein [Moraxella bovis]|nr:hypothetical protein [Moraxella bovis]